MSIITIVIDLAKNVFAFHGVNESGNAELVKPKVQRDSIYFCLTHWRSASYFSSLRWVQ